MKALVKNSGVNCTKAILLCGAAALGFASAGTANAQESGAEDGRDGLNVIVVTARKKAESLQEVPVTVTSIGGDTLDTYQVTNVDKLQSRVPSLTIQQGGANGGASLSIRGVGTANLSPAFDSAVALDFDGVQIGQLRILQAGFFDIAQIDVLKGPQSLFFGKSASAGVLTLTSAGPTVDWEVGGRLGYEFEEKGYIGEAYISGPLTDTLGIRLAGRYNKIDELLINEAPNVAKPKRGSEDIYVRGTVAWDPVDIFSADLKVSYINSKRDGASLFADIDCGPNGVADPIVLFGGTLQIPAGYSCNAGDGIYSYPDAAPPLAASQPPPFRSTTVPYHESDIWLGRLKMGLELSDQLSLTAISGFYSLRSEELEAYSYGGNLGGVSFGTGLGTPRVATDQFSQELRVDMTDLGPLDLTIGAFYEYKDSDFDAPLYAVNIAIAGPDPVTGYTADLLKLQNTKSEAFSVFANASVDLTERLNLSGGLRYTDESKTSRISVPFQHLFLASSGAFLPSNYFSGPIDFKDDNFSPEVSLTYEVADDINLYAAYKTGFKSGGIDSAVLPTLSLQIAKDNDDFSAITFQSEESKGGEIGMKSELFDRQLRFNVTAYRYAFSNLQVQLFDPIAIQYSTLNASEVTTTGIDVDFFWQTPATGLTLSGAIGYLDSKYTEDYYPLDDTATPTVLEGDNLRGRAPRNAPDFSGNVAFDYRVPLGGLELGLNGNVSYTGSYFIADRTSTDAKQSDFFTFDAAVSIGEPGGKWKLSLAAVNIADKLYLTSDTGRPFLPPTGDDRIVSYNRGRQVFLDASFKF
ncbi:TonB-dependent receptor [Sphingorhabdus sp. SMR4y]|uniref:TonB-dependent receptor n=1 Tax=Sphingorhabdus sp. SMR4y TaxID=2584094 RepID=UPI000B60C076|nr:TonB-dependent receptor [Sphingorhabdus sp. SMR4y]ASK88143.1 pesticin receptor [Sphingorhabdus sp. SMR4y]